MAKDVYSDFKSGTPGGSDYGFRSQIQRAAVSTMNNIAEGFERSSNPEFVRFLDIAKASYGEVRSMYYAAEDLSYATTNTSQERRDDARKIAAGIASLQSHLRNKT